jgi:hypothetical protein
MALPQTSSVQTPSLPASGGSGFGQLEGQSEIGYHDEATREFPTGRGGVGHSVSLVSDVMARKIVNRKELRAEVEAAEKSGVAKKKKAAKAPTKRKSRAKVASTARMKLFWGVFNQSLKRVALYEFNQRKQAEKKAAELTKSAKTPHFVQRVKETIEE